MTVEKSVGLVRPNKQYKLLFPTAWKNYMMLWWTLLANGAFTVIVVYGLYLIVHH